MKARITVMLNSKGEAIERPKSFEGFIGGNGERLMIFDRSERLLFELHSPRILHITADSLIVAGLDRYKVSPMSYRHQEINIRQGRDGKSATLEKPRVLHFISGDEYAEKRAKELEENP